MSKNYHIKISVSLPLRVVEKLDKLTTYKGRSRSKYIAGAVAQRMEAVSPDFAEMELDYLLKLSIAKFGTSEKDIFMREIIRDYLFPVDSHE